ncbi:MAG: hypothetical protein ACLU4N_06835 [Butyricimonas faecihominis]
MQEVTVRPNEFITIPLQEEVSRWMRWLWWVAIGAAAYDGCSKTVQLRKSRGGG